MLFSILSVLVFLFEDALAILIIVLVYPTVHYRRTLRTRGAVLEARNRHVLLTKREFRRLVWATLIVHVLWIALMLLGPVLFRNPAYVEANQTALLIYALLGSGNGRVSVPVSVFGLVALWYNTREARQADAFLLGEQSNDTE